ncbi:mitochondrial ribonuclease P protein 1 homolog [Aethina tumida]|uniref:mitochondrial ribonuclease P protein 1 homolog n=1 Tax=Aethina tumida TaxID=116153 RepID=UPI002148BF46|nr:mitochondrial ribonuclease P protein 1 homolog [Aethina tumida]
MFNFSRNCRHLIKLSEFFNSSYKTTNQIKCALPTTQQINYFQVKSFSQSTSEPTNAPEETTENEYDQIDYEGLSNGDKEVEHKLRIIALELEVMRQEGRPVPPLSFVQPDKWIEAVNLPTRTGRKKFFEYLFKLSKKKENQLLKKEQKKLERGEKPEMKVIEDLEEFAHAYDLQHNNIFLRFYESTMNQLYNNKLIQAMQFGQKIVIDCGYDQNMSNRENTNTAKQLLFCFADNRLHSDPYDLHFCNFHSNTVLKNCFLRHIPTAVEPHFPINMHEESYLDKFPKEQLVYLTPHCREELLHYDHDAIYIIGGIVDKMNNEPLSLAKAKREGLRMAKLPLDRYLQWGSGSGKSLTLNQVINIMNDMKVTGDWAHSLRHVPKRKLAEFNIDENMSRSSDRPVYDRVRRERKWVPSPNIDLSNLRYNNDKREWKPKSTRTRLDNIFRE